MSDDKDAKVQVNDNTDNAVISALVGAPVQSRTRSGVIFSKRPDWEELSKGLYTN